MNDPFLYLLSYDGEDELTMTMTTMMIKSHETMNRLVTCCGDCDRLQSDNSVLSRRLDDEHHRVIESERREQEAVQRVRDTLQLVDEAQMEKEQVIKWRRLRPAAGTSLKI